MLRPALAGFVALGLTLSAASGQSTMHCAEIYKNHLEKLNQKQLSQEQRAALRRSALRAYNACETGDMQDAKGLFQRLDRSLP